MKALLVSFPLGHLANDWAPASIWLLAPAIGAAMGLSPSEIGLLITISYMGASMGYLPAGILADRVSHQGRLLAATFWWVAIGYFLASLAPGFWSLAILLAVAGMGDAAWHPIATGVLVEQAPKRRGMVLGIHAMGGTLSEVGAPLTVGLLLSLVDWRTALQVSVLPAVVMGVVFLFLLPRIPRSASAGVSRLELGRITRHWMRPRGLQLIGMISIYNMALMALMSMSPLFLQRELGHGPALAGAVFAAAMLAGSLLQPWIGRFSDTRDRYGVFIAGSCAGILLSLGAALLVSPPWIIVSLGGAMAILIAVRSGVLASAVDYASSRAATTLGFVFMLLDGVGALGALLAGWVAEVDLRYCFLLAAALSTTSVLLAFGLRRAGPLHDVATGTAMTPGVEAPGPGA